MYQNNTSAPNYTLKKGKQEKHNNEG